MAEVCGFAEFQSQPHRSVMVASLQEINAILAYEIHNAVLLG